MTSGPRLHSQPNITPLIDVLLVLLIIFLFSVRLSQEGIDLSLPREAAVGHEGGDAQIVLEYSADRRITLNAQPVAPQALQGRLREIYRDRRDRTMWLSGAGSLRYGEIVEVIDAAKGAGVERVGVITPAMWAASPVRGGVVPRRDGAR